MSDDTGRNLGINVGSSGQVTKWEKVLSGTDKLLGVTGTLVAITQVTVEWVIVAIERNCCTIASTRIRHHDSFQQFDYPSSFSSTGTI